MQYLSILFKTDLPNLIISHLITLRMIDLQMTYFFYKITTVKIYKFTIL